MSHGAPCELIDDGPVRSAVQGYLPNIGGTSKANLVVASKANLSQAILNVYRYICLPRLPSLQQVEQQIPSSFLSSAVTLRYMIQTTQTRQTHHLPSLAAMYSPHLKCSHSFAALEPIDPTSGTPCPVSAPSVTILFRCRCVTSPEP